VASGVLQRVKTRTLSMLGYSPAVLELASPWSDPSHLAHIDLRALFYVGENWSLDRGSAMKIATVAKLRNMIAGTIGRLPLYDVKAGVRNPNPRTILTSPDPTIPRSTLLTWTVDQLIFYPCTWWHVIGRDFYGWPNAVELVMRHDAELNGRGELVRINGNPVSPADVIRFDAPSAGLLTDGERTLRRAMVIEAAAARAEDNPVPSFELHNVGENLSEQEIDQLLTRWVEARRKYGVAYTSKGLETKDHGAAPEQLLIDGRRRVDLEIVRHMNAQPWMAGVATEGTSLTYANVQDQWRDAINITFAPYMSAVADRLSMPDVTPRGWEVRFDADSLTQDPQGTRFANYEVGLRAGFLTQEQIAAWEGWPTPTGVPAA
jgi:hypothetical protein